jgi:hypothetical protein
MYKHFFGLVLSFFLTSGILKSHADVKTIQILIAKSELTKAMEAVNLELKKSPRDLQHLALKARIESLQGDAAKDEDTKVKLYERAQKTANELIKAHPNSAKGYNRRAVAKGKLILFKGILESRSLVLDLRKDAKKVLGMKNLEAYDKALANYLLGRAHLKLATKPRALRMPLGLAWASDSKGGEFLNKAVELSPNTISFNLSYAKWLKDKGQTAKSKALLEKIASIEVFDPADTGHKQTAKDLLSKL